MTDGFKLPEQTEQYEVRGTFPALALRAISAHPLGLGLELDFQSATEPQYALRVAIAASDARRMLAALQDLERQVRMALESGAMEGPAAH